MPTKTKRRPKRPVRQDPEPEPDIADLVGDEPDPAQELDAAEAAIAAEFPEQPPPPPPPPPPPGGEPEEEVDVGEAVEDLAEAAAERIDVAAELDAAELADVWQVLFGVIADKRGAHWELPDRSAQRLGRWSFRVLERHPELLQWLAKNLPELVLGLLVVLEVGQRVSEDRRLRAAGARTAGTS